MKVPTCDYGYLSAQVDVPVDFVRDAIDGAARSRGMTRSAFLSSAARRELLGV